MSRRLIFSPAANDDLDGIYSFIADDKPAAALRFVRRLRLRCSPLAKNPFVGEDCSELGPRMRRLSFDGYLIFFRVDGDSVNVMRFIHGARDWQQLF
jgi:toxin ParE1/3/4